MACLDENALTGFIQGVLSNEEAQRVEKHVDECSDCRALLSALSRLSLDRTISRVTEPSPELAALASEPGQVIAGKYRVDRLLGAGGMGLVVAATHLELNQIVALKFMQPSVLGNADASARFLREARAVARLKSEHVGRVLDIGRLDSGAPYIVMEYLEGQDLDTLVAANGPLPIETATDYLLQALEAVAEAHAAGIVHRDLKPANLFLARATGGTSCVKVLDFGVSKYVEPGSSADLGRTDGRAVVGSPLYMAPEQLVSAGTVDVRADVWSLGCTLYQLVSGKTPFEGTTLPQLTASILKGAPTPLRMVRPDAPAGFEEIVSRCLAKEPAKRYGDVAELAQALSAFAPMSAKEQVARIGTVLGVGLGVESSPDDLATASKPRRQVPRTLAVAGILAVLAALAFFVLGQKDTPGGASLPAKPAVASSVPASIPDPPAAVEPAPSPAVPPAVSEPVAAAPKVAIGPSKAPPAHSAGMHRKPKAPKPATSEVRDEVFGTRK